MSAAGTLRLAAPLDADAIRDLTRAAYARWVPVIGREPRPMAADYAEAVRTHRFDLLHVGDVFAALIETVPEEGALLIVNVAVAPGFEGRGLGSRLLAHAEDLARSQGFAETRLYTNKAFVENLRLYLRLGYRADREEEWGGGFVVHMSKRLAPIS